MSKIGSERTVIVKLIGGLGNQMFQYAIGRSLSIHLDGELWLDVSALEKSSRQYELGALSVVENFAPRDVVRFFSPPISMASKLGHLLKINRRWPDHYFQEKNLSYHSELLELTPPLYLDGYWQSPCHFEAISNVIIEEFQVKKPLIGKSCELAVKIGNVNSVSVHIRRGDYVSDPVTNAYHGTCDNDYYLRAMKMMADLINCPHFFIFSDEPIWVEENYPKEYSLTVVSHNSPLEPHEDLRLMSLCEHHIIANSSFSWWGAWLSKKPDKIVISPQRWFRDSSRDTSNMIPSKWIRI